MVQGSEAESFKLVENHFDDFESSSAPSRLDACVCVGTGCFCFMAAYTGIAVVQLHSRAATFLFLCWCVIRILAKANLLRKVFTGAAVC